MRFSKLLLIALSFWSAACSSATAVAGDVTPLTPPVAASSTQTPGPIPTRSPASPIPSPTAILLPSPTPIPEIHLLFTGDINPARCVYWISKAADDMALPYRPLAEILQSADLTIGSLDASISDYNAPTPCIETTRNLLAPSETVQGLQFAGFDMMTVATNHIKDCGLVRGCAYESMLDTLAHLRAAEIQPIGAGKNLAEAVAPVVLTVQGVRFAFLGFSAINAPLWATETLPGVGPFEEEIYLDAIRRARAQAEVVIVLPHWGREFTPEITWEQWQAAAEMVEAGATLVVGNNPHHVQGVETFPNGAVVAYALGNFVFDMQWTDGTLYTVQGILLEATFRGARLQNVDLIPIHIYDNFQPRLAPPEEAAMILQDVANSLAQMPER
jgi:poly-gamma-glutamate capsule biosynthesis protein CapA/YwtB (metallophosphatase superfamily)